MKDVREVRECIELCSTFHNYAIVISSTEIYANSCVVLNHEKQTETEDQTLKINLEWP